jgi:hypothetical protein
LKKYVFELIVLGLSKTEFKRRCPNQVFVFVIFVVKFMNNGSERQPLILLRHKSGTGFPSQNKKFSLVKKIRRERKKYAVKKKQSQGKFS